METTTTGGSGAYTSRNQFGGLLSNLTPEQTRADQSRAEQSRIGRGGALAKAHESKVNALKRTKNANKHTKIHRHTLTTNANRAKLCRRNTREGRGSKVNIRAHT